MVTDTTSLDSTRQPSVIQPFITLVQISNPTGETYTAQYVTIGNAIVEQIEIKIGPEPSECVIFIPAKVVTPQLGGDRGAFDHNMLGVRGANNRLSPVTHPQTLYRDISLGSKIRVMAIARTSINDLLDTSTVPRLFVGYVTKIEPFAQGKDSSGLRLICKDGRFLLSKTPVQGVLFYNFERDKHVYIRDADLVFNAGKRPTRYNDPSDGYISEQSPRFINFDFSRFLNQPGNDEDRLYMPDSVIADPDLIKFVPTPFAHKWFAGHVWNYCRNIISKDRMTGDFNARQGRMYNDPASALTQDDLPPLYVDQEVLIPVLSDTGLDDDMYHDFFEPRAEIGAVNQTGLGTAATAIGEFTVTGQPANEVFFNIVRQIGNYTIAAYYTTDDKMRLEPIRSIPGYTEERNKQNKTVAVGLRGRPGGSGGGKRLELTMPSPSSAVVKPSIHTYRIGISIDNYGNRVHMKAGPRILQLTFVSVAQQADITDIISSPNNQVHKAYAPAGEWQPVPITNAVGAAIPSLRPAWPAADETAWIDLFRTGDDLQQFPDVFRVWVIPEDIDWVQFLNVTDDGGTPVDETIGFRRFFERDREALSELIISSFQNILGLFRRRRAKLPITVWRGFRGIRTNTDGDTAYGNSATEGDALTGFADWYRMPASVDVLTDGRLGFQLGLEARTNTLYPFENHAAGVPAGSGNTTSAASWNAVFAAGGSPHPDARSYEMMFTVAFKMDEDLWEYIRVPNSGAQSIVRYGPPMEIYRDGGSEYLYEEAIHSVIEDPRQGTRMLAIPPSTGTTDDEKRVYRDDRDEVSARARMLANRHSLPDVEGEVHLAGINLDYWAGDFISELKRAGDSPIPVSTLVDAVTHDFVNQQTSLHLATIR